VLTDEAATLLAAKLKTPLQIGQHLVRAFEAGMDGVCLGRKWKPSPRSSRRPWQGRNSYRRGDSRPAVMALSGVVLVAMLIIFRPPLPSWLPGPVLTAFSAVEGLRDR
jgi:hypothetical protein